MHMDSCQVVIEDIGPGWAGDEAPEFVLLVSSHQIHINPPSQVLHGLPEDRVVHQLVEVLLEVAGGLFPELCIHLDVWLHPRALIEPEGTMDLTQTHAQTCIAADSDSEAHSGPCYGGLGPASQPLLAPPQHRGGCTDTPTSTFSEPSCAPAPTDMHCVRCGGLLCTQGPPQVCSPRARRLVALQWFLRAAGHHPPTESHRWGDLDSSPTRRDCSHQGIRCGYWASLDRSPCNPFSMNRCWS